MSGGYLSGGYLSGGICPRIIRSMYQKNNLFACLHYTLYIIV